MGVGAQHGSGTWNSSVKGWKLHPGRWRMTSLLGPRLDQASEWRAGPSPAGSPDSGMARERLGQGRCESQAGAAAGVSPTGARASLGNGYPATRPPARPVGARSKVSSKARAIGSGCEPSTRRAAASPPRPQNRLSCVTPMRPRGRQVGARPRGIG